MHSKRPRIILIATLLCAVALLTIGCARQTGESNAAQPSTESVTAEQSNSKSTSKNTSQTKPVQTEVENLIAEYGDHVGIGVSYLDGSGGFEINGNRQFVSASMIKLLILAEFIKQLDANTVSLTNTYTLKASDIVGGAGIIGSNGEGSTYTLDELAYYMIAESDNTSTNVLIDILGLDTINTRASELGLLKTDLERKMMDESGTGQNHMSVTDAETILAGIANHTIASESACNKALDYLYAQTDDEALAQGIPNGVAFAHKTGALDTCRHDAGIVYCKKPYIIAVFTEEVPSPESLMETISKTVYEAALAQ